MGQVVHLHTSQDQINYLWTYDLNGPVCNAFDAGKYITRASGRGLGPGNQDFLGPVKRHRVVSSPAAVRIKSFKAGEVMKLHG